MVNRIFNIRGKNIIYKLENFSDLSEQKAIDISLGCAFNMSQFILHNLKSADANTARIMRKIYGENADAQTLSTVFKGIVGRIEKKFFARREKVFIGEGGEEKPEVFSGADCGLQKIIIYDAFFKRMPSDESGLNDRASVLIHEMAHLNGLEGDEELGSINSAESLRNFALLACGLVDEEKLFAKIEESAQGKLQGEDGELPYRPDQPRAPKGQPNGGQWIKDKTKSDANNTEKKGNNTKKISGILNLQDNGIKLNNKGNWAAANLKIKGLKPNTRYTVTIKYTYKYYSEEEQKTVKRDVKIAMDAISDENGEIDFERVGVLGEFNPNAKDNDYQKGDINITSTVGIAEGSVQSNYGIPDKADTNSDLDSEENEVYRKKYKVGFYPVYHASQEKWSNTDIPNDYQGGDVSGRKDPPSLKEVSNGTFHYDGENTETSGDNENNAISEKRFFNPHGTCE